MLGFFSPKTGSQVNRAATLSGFIGTYDFYTSVARGLVAGHVSINRIGHDQNVGTDLATIGNQEGSIQTYSSSADIDSISSDNAGDTYDITIEGLDANYDEVPAQVVTLNGQNRVAIPIPLFRIQNLFNATAVATLGNLWVYVNTALSSGKPGDITKIRCSIHFVNGVSNERATCSVYTVPANKTALIAFGKTSVSDSKALELSFWGRQAGGVFGMQHPVDVKNNYYDYFFKLPLMIPAKSDLEVRGKVDVGTANVSAVFDLILIDD